MKKSALVAAVLLSVSMMGSAYAGNTYTATNTITLVSGETWDLSKQSGAPYTAFDLQVTGGVHSIVVPDGAVGTKLIIHADDSICISAEGNGRGLTSYSGASVNPSGTLIDLSAAQIDIVGGTGDGRGISMFGENNVININQDVHQDGIINISGGNLGAYVDGAGTELHMDGSAITLKATSDRGLGIESGAKVYINENNTNGTIDISGSDHGAYVGGAGTELHMDGSDIKIKSTGDTGYLRGIGIESGAKVYINENNTNGTIDISGSGHGIFINEGSELHMDGSVITLKATSDRGIGIQSGAKAYINQNNTNGTIGISGGNLGAYVSGAGTELHMDSSVITLKGTSDRGIGIQSGAKAYINQNNTNGTIGISGGNLGAYVSGAGTELHMDGSAITLKATSDRGLGIQRGAKVYINENNTNGTIDISGSDYGTYVSGAELHLDGSQIEMSGSNGNGLNLFQSDVYINKKLATENPEKLGNVIIFGGWSAIWQSAGNLSLDGKVVTLTDTNEDIDDTPAGAVVVTGAGKADINKIYQYGTVTINGSGNTAADYGAINVTDTSELNIYGSGIDVNGDVIGTGYTVFHTAPNTQSAITVDGKITGSKIDFVLDNGAADTVTISGVISNVGTLGFTGDGDKDKVTITGETTGGGVTNFEGVCVKYNANSIANTVNVKNNATLNVDSSIQFATLNFENGSTLIVDEANMPVITITTDAYVGETSKLVLKNVEAKPYIILSGVDDGWTVDNITLTNAIYNVVVDEVTDQKFVVTLEKKDAKDIPSDIANIISKVDENTAVGKWVNGVMETYSGNEDVAYNAINTVANMSAVAGVQTGAASMVTSVANNLSSNLGSSARPNLMGGNKGGLRNTAADKGEIKIDTVEVGKAADVMPERYLAKAYNKEVWASYIHSKQRVDGLKAGMLSNQSTMQYNGVTVGADLWSGKHSFGGVALSYADGNTNAGNLRNDTDYYGVSIYNRHDYKGLIMLTDVSYTHSKNDINISGVQEITADAKADAIGVGVRFETPMTMGKTTVTPYAGARYIYLKNKDYKNNLGMEYDTDNQNLVTIPVGLQISAEFNMPESDWTFRPVLEGGYVWNLGDRDGNTKIGYMGAYDTVGFETSDPGQYFIRAAMQFAKADFTCEVGYRYSKGKSVRDNRWNVNMNYAF